jgi:SAM-dependent methyltransferase
MNYDQQARGDRSAYERYLRGMDASMKQKVALTAAHLLAQGRVADMGMGSGSGSYALAALYPSLDVVGVDINPTMVELAREHYKLPNLSFAVGDIGAPCFPESSLDGIFDSSVLHHVTTFSGYDHDAAARALEVQARMLKRHGMLIVRDFVDPGDGDVILELPADDGALFRQFACEFRKLSDHPGFAFEERDGRFKVSRKIAAEFVLRKDYRRDWNTEILEEYTYLSQRGFEQTFSRLGLRIVASTPLWNPWIVHHRFEGRFTMRDLDGHELEFPPTNYLIAGEKVGPDEGVRFVERERSEPAGFLSMEHYRNRHSGAVYDLVRRPRPTIDVIPWFENAGEIFILARKSYPRPIVAAADIPTLDGSTPAQYVTEPFNVLQIDDPLGRTVVDSLRPIVSADRVRSFAKGCVYYPSPGGIEEQVRSSLVEIDPAGQTRAIEATQLLRAAQVGGMSEARLEINTYHLLRHLRRNPGPWIGDAIELSTDTEFKAADIAVSFDRQSRRVFETADASASTRFLDLRCSRFEELAANGSTVSSHVLEYVVPRSLSINTIATALLTRSGGEVLIGVDDDDLPAAQSFNGNSELLVAPAWRLPRNIVRRRDAKRWIEERLMREYGIRAKRFWELGGQYHPSPGITPERVMPFAVEIDAQVSPALRPLCWLPLADAIRYADRIQDGHLRIVLFRASHALGLL